MLPAIHQRRKLDPADRILLSNASCHLGAEPIPDRAFNSVNCCKPLTRVVVHQIITCSFSQVPHTDGRRKVLRKEDAFVVTRVALVGACAQKLMHKCRCSTKRGHDLILQPCSFWRGTQHVPSAFRNVVQHVEHHRGQTTAFHLICHRLKVGNVAAPTIIAIKHRKTTLIARCWNNPAVVRNQTGPHVAPRHIRVEAFSLDTVEGAGNHIL